MSKTVKRLIPINDVMYHKDILVVVGYTEKEIQDYILNKYGIEYNEHGYDGSLYYFTNKITKCRKFILWLGDDFDWSIRSQKTLVHEIFHLVCRVMDYIDIKLCEESEEAFAYYYDHLFGEIAHKLAIIFKAKKVKK